MDLTTGLWFIGKGLHNMPDILKKVTLFWKILILVLTIFWIIMLINCLQRKFPSDTDKIAWVLVLIFIPILGAFIYWFSLYFNLRKPKKKK